jgi:hypothetical protein
MSFNRVLICTFVAPSIISPFSQGGPVRHGNDAGLKIRPSHRDRLMKIMGKCRYAAATRKMIADERYTLN